VPTDLPRYDRPERPDGSRSGLPDRQDRLPVGHPSSPRYLGRDGEASRIDSPASLPDWRWPTTEIGDPDARRHDADKRLPAAERPEWHEPLARGEVDRVGLGVVDERASTFQPRERRLADHLAGQGSAVVAIHDGYGRAGRMPDAAVDGVWTEFKSLDPGASDRTVKAALTSAKGQARHAVIDGRGSGLASDQADRGVRRFLGTPHAARLDEIRIIADDFDLHWKRG
jgi:hypothetical protein